jgi:hypothetical protein
MPFSYSLPSSTKDPARLDHEAWGSRFARAVL